MMLTDFIPVFLVTTLPDEIHERRYAKCTLHSSRAVRTVLSQYELICYKQRKVLSAAADLQQSSKLYVR